MKNKRYYVNEDYPSETWESILALSEEAARKILTDEEFAEWLKDRDAMMKASAEEAKRYSETHYFPGCYGDAWTDC